ncbi:MAG: diaminopimelate epimerase [Gemmatimonadota bacterium]|nr:diaminopimelate epimerase [Gemmatimonadota bacterium]
MPSSVGRPFFKMSGSGNDFIFFDCRSEPCSELRRPDVIRSLCARGEGIGADGVVLLERSTSADLAMTYFNSDGTLASLCGNASLCTVSLAAVLREGSAQRVRVETGSGVLEGQLRDGLPEIELQPVADVRPDPGIAPAASESRIGFAFAGVPHLVVLCADVEQIDLSGRGATLRHHSSLPEGANVNFVAAGEGGRWRIRTFERGVEGETLACGTGAVAAAILLSAWGSSSPCPLVELETRSRRILGVRLRRSEDAWYPALRGEGRLVYRGTLADLG